jgi:hypothetical protein
VKRMSNIVDVIKSAGANFVGGASNEMIEQAERKLNFKFPKEYKELVESLGVVSIGSQEIFGLGVEGYLNVVETTLEERKQYPELLDNYIVIQNLSMEGVLILLDDRGEVFEFHNGKTKMITQSLVGYLKEEVIS